jgi:hypothetical protein
MVLTFILLIDDIVRAGNFVLRNEHMIRDYINDNKYYFKKNYDNFNYNGFSKNTSRRV